MSTINYEEAYKKIKEREKRSYQRRAVKVELIIKKAVAAGIVVTEKEVDAAYAIKYPSKTTTPTTPTKK